MQQMLRGGLGCGDSCCWTELRKELDQLIVMFESAVALMEEGSVLFELVL
jgi:hypothetical protein